MYDLTTLLLPLLILARNGPVIATKIAALHPYRDGHSIKEEIIGRRVTVVFPGAGYQTLDVKVSDPTDALTPLLDKGNPVYVDFDNFVGKIYYFADKTLASVVWGSAPRLPQFALSQHPIRTIFSSNEGPRGSQTADISSASGGNVGVSPR